MKLLLDQGLPRSAAALLRAKSIDAVHTGEIGYARAEDVVFTLDPEHPPQTDWSRFEAMAEEQRHAAALTDPDCPPATEEQLARALPIPDVKALRKKLDLSQEQFTHKFQLSLGAVRDWEQGKHQPDRAARALLRLIDFNAELVQQALQQEY